MELIKEWVGRQEHGLNGNSTLRPVEFQGEKLGELSTSNDNRGNRGTAQTLYKTGSGYIVAIQDWSHWQNESDDYTLEQVTASDLNVNGRFEMLGRECKVCSRPLTLEEALID